MVLAQDIEVVVARIWECLGVREYRGGGRKDLRTSWNLLDNWCDDMCYIRWHREVCGSEFTYREQTFERSQIINEPIYHTKAA